MTATRHVFVSPHLDDAVLSGGGYIYRLAKMRQRVVVATVGTSDCPGPVSWVAKRNLLSWRRGVSPFAARRKEDEDALEVLGAEFVHLGLLDAMYRRDKHGHPLYTTRTTDVPVHADDWERHKPAVRQAIEGLLEELEGETIVYCPLGIGGHVDHLLVRSAVEEAADRCSIVYYEDQPYAWRVGESLDVATLVDGKDRKGSFVVHLSEEEMEARAQAIACYRSQLPGLFPSRPERLAEIVRARLPLAAYMVARNVNTASARARMESSLGSYTERIGGERYWHRCADRISALPQRALP